MKLVAATAFMAPVIALVGWFGLRVRPAPFPPLAAKGGKVETVPLPSGLPAPVERYYRLKYGDWLPLVSSAIISGRGSMRLFGLRVPIRFRFTHEAGRNFRHDIDMTFFGLPLMQARETYIDERGWARTPGGIDEGEGFDQGSNVSLWAEALNWFPAILATDPRVKWEAVDDATALLVTPFKGGQEKFVVRFDPSSGRPQHVEAMKFNSALRKQMLWISGTWAHEGKPWLFLDVEDVILNAEVRGYIRSLQESSAAGRQSAVGAP